MLKLKKMRLSLEEKPVKSYHRATEIKDWINSEEFKKLKELPEEIKTRLKAAGIWRRYLEQSLKDYAKESNNFDSEVITDEEERTWQNLSNKKLGLSKEEVREKIKTNNILKKLSKEKWGNSIESIFLERKSEFDKASCKILRMGNKNLLTELYFRIKENEISFERASTEYGQLPEKKSGGNLGYKPLREMEFGLGPLLEKMDVGQLSAPLKIGNGYCLVMLEKFKGAELNDEIREIILYEKLKSWFKKGVDQAVDILE